MAVIYSLRNNDDVARRSQCSRAYRSLSRGSGSVVLHLKTPVQLMEALTAMSMPCVLCLSEERQEREKETDSHW